jgi:hypothetical protein
MPYLVVTVPLSFCDDDMVDYKGIILIEYVLTAGRITY